MQVAELKLDLNKRLKVNKLAVKTLRIARQRAAQQQFKEKEKSKSIPSAMRISWTIEKIVWNMISDGQAFAEAEISSMVSTERCRENDNGLRKCLNEL